MIIDDFFLLQREPSRSLCASKICALFTIFLLFLALGEEKPFTSRKIYKRLLDRSLTRKKREIVIAIRPVIIRTRECYEALRYPEY